MIRIRKHKIKNEKILNKQKVLLIADIHLWDNYNKKIIEELSIQVQKLKPNIICICGDLIDEFRFLQKEKNKIMLLDLLNNLSEFAPTLITLGSHDFFNQKKLNTGNISSDAIEYWHQMLNENNNDKIHLLNNTIYENNDIRIIGYTNSRDYFHYLEKEEILIDEINNKISIRNNNKKYTILMSHSPMCINKNTLPKLKIYSSLNLVLSGHMHNGLVFPILDKLPSTIGIISPSKTFFPTNSRGLKTFKFKDKEIKLVINGGFLKFSNMAPNILKKINKLYFNDIDLIEINNK